MEQIRTIPERSAQSPENLWAIADLYPSDEAWYADLAEFRAQVRQLQEYAGRLGRSAGLLLAYLKRSEENGVLLDRLANYAQRRNDEDTRVPAYQAMVDQLTAAWVEAETATAFAAPEILRLDDAQLDGFYAQEPELEAFRRYLTRLRRLRDHVLSDAEERLLAAAGEMAGAPESIYSVFSDADLRFDDAVDGAGERHPLSQGTYVGYLQSADRALRQSAFASMYRAMGDYRNTMAATLSAQVKQLQFFAQARRYDSPLAAALAETEVPTEVYHNLIDTVHRHLGKLHRYTALRKRVMGLETLHMYDLYTPLVSGCDEKVSFRQAKELVYDALAPLGDSYRAILREGFENRWIDVYENVGKRSGAYSAGARVHPYVLLNFTGDLDSQFTLAHEMGHAIHSYLSNRTQRPVDADYVIFVAEVASTCNEALLMEHLLADAADKKRRAYLLNHFLEQFRGTLYRQTMFAEFELRLGELNRQGEALTAQRLCEEYRALNRRYYGDAVVSDEEIGLEWARIPHFYYNYYVFQYATGYAAAIALSRRILREGAPAVADYLQFLSGGCSRDPISLLRLAGVDLSTPEPVEQALELFGQLLDELQALLEED